MRRLVRLLGALALAALALASVAPAATAAPLPRRFVVTLSPAVGDFALAELSFPRAHRRALNASSLRIAVPGADGDDYTAAGTVAQALGGRRISLVLVASRPTKAMIPAHLRLRAVVSKSLGPVLVRSVTNPLTAPRKGPSWMCGLARGGAAPVLRGLMSHGERLASLSATAAFGQAFDVACGLPYSDAFRKALQGTATETPSPEPVPPPGPPKCSPCNPQPGRACPLTAVAAVCVAGQARRPASAAPN